MGKKYEGICVPRKSSQRVTSVEEDFNTQVDRMTYYMNTSQSFFPATHVIAQQAHEQSSHCSQDRGYAWTQLHGPSLTKAKLAKAITECANWQQQRRTLGPLHGTIPGWTVDYIWPLPSWKGQCFILNRINIYSGHTFTFSACKSSAQITILWVYRTPNLPSWYSTQHCF